MEHNTGDTDPFDRVYVRWGDYAIDKYLDPPSREKWDTIVLRLLLSQDPARVQRYKWIESTGPESLGADAYELWSKMPGYTPNLSVSMRTWPEFLAYEKSGRGSMKRLMESQGLLDRYNAIIGAQAERKAERKAELDKARARRGQQSVMVMGCAGIALIGIMLLLVLLIIAIKLL